MIKFFRKIRQKLLNENKFSKYLLYAIGEIVLVVIGILIALSINNWNDYRKNRILEQKALSNFSISLKSNIDFLTKEIEWLKKYNHSANTIIYAIENNQKERKGLYRHFHFAYLNPMLSLDKSGYETLNNIGLEIIISDSLKNKIIHLYGHNYTQTENIINTSESKFADLHIYMRTNFFAMGNLRAKPFDYDTVMNNNYYYSSIQYLQLQRGWYINLMQKIT